ncbi:hypothetical protein Tco_0638744, partial [Tanacetum coccineum]
VKANGVSFWLFLSRVLCTQSSLPILAKIELAASRCGSLFPHAL